MKDDVVAADGGYTGQWSNEYGIQVILPHRKPQKAELPPQLEAENQEFSEFRGDIERVQSSTPQGSYICSCLGQQQAVSHGWVHILKVIKEVKHIFLKTSVVVRSFFHF